MNKKLNNKKGVELTLNTIVIFILGLLVLLVVIFFFGGNYSKGNDQIKNISDDVLNEYGFP